MTESGGGETGGTDAAGGAAEMGSSGAAGYPQLTVVRIARLELSLLASLVEYGRAALGDSALDEWLLPVIAGHGRLYAGMAGDEIAGAAEIIRCFEGNDLYLEGLYVRPEFQGRGYGSQLLTGVMRLLSGEGDFSRVIATVDPANAAGRRIYAKAGFIETAIEQNHYGPGRDRIVLAAWLGNITNK